MLKYSGTVDFSNIEADFSDHWWIYPRPATTPTGGTSGLLGYNWIHEDGSWFVWITQAEGIDDVEFEVSYVSGGERIRTVPEGSWSLGSDPITDIELVITAED